MLQRSSRTLAKSKSVSSIYKETSEIINNNEMVMNSRNNRRKRLRDEADSFDNLKKPKTIVEDNIYSEFNKLNLPKGQYCNEYRKFVSATAVGNFLMNDPVLDWLKEYYGLVGLNNKEELESLTEDEKLQAMKDRETQCLQEQEIVSVLFKMGNKFEDNVYSFLKQNYPDSYIQIGDGNEEIKLNPEKYTTTLECMKAGYPIILQGHVINYSNKTYGWPDLLIRSDWVNKLFENEILTNNESCVSAPAFGNNKYHYVVVDIKWSSLKLRADGKHILNANRAPANKGQLLIYNVALGEMQGYIPPKAYLMGKSWSYTSKNNKYSGYSCFDRLGVVDFTDDKLDKQFIDKTNRAIYWIREVKLHGREWEFLPIPSRNELYPNMSNRYDAPFHKAKKEIATLLNEHTLIVGVGESHRNIALEKSIFGYNDENCCSENYGINPKSEKGKMIDAVLIANKANCSKNFIPDIVSNNTDNWQTGTPIEFFIDFEECDPKLFNGIKCQYNSSDYLFNSKTDGSFIFMFGIYVVTPTYKKYVCFKADRYNESSEKKVVDEAFKFMCDCTNNYMKENNVTNIIPLVYHWSPAEIVSLNRVNSKNNNRWRSYDSKFKYVDACKIFKAEPISIKGSLNHKLKNVAIAMHKHGMINTIWQDSSVSDGYHAAQKGSKYYNFMNNYDHAIDKTLLQTSLNKHNEEFADLEEYNRVDCVTVYEIIDYIRNNHVRY